MLFEVFLPVDATIEDAESFVVRYLEHEPEDRHAHCFKPYTPPANGWTPRAKQQQQQQQQQSTHAKQCHHEHSGPDEPPPSSSSSSSSSPQQQQPPPEAPLPKNLTKVNTIPEKIQPLISQLEQETAMSKRGQASQAPVWKVGKAATEVSISETKTISKDVLSKTWKTVRFTSTVSRGVNTNKVTLGTKAIQTAPTGYKLRLKRWPQWTDPGHGGPSVFSFDDNGAAFYHPLWSRRVLSFVFSQFGIVAFLVTWVCAYAALFQHFEQQLDIKLVNDVTISRNDLVINLATELRQVFPYEMAWRRKIDDYFIRFEATLNNATQRGYSTSRRAFYKWDYLDFLLFAIQLVTGQGYGTDVPKTEWSLVLTIPCVLIGLPFMWLFLVDLGAKWADALTASIQKIRLALARRFPDVLALQEDLPKAPRPNFLPIPPLIGALQQQNGRVAPAVGSGTPLAAQANGTAAQLDMIANGGDYQRAPDDATPVDDQPVWTVEPARLDTKLPLGPLHVTKIRRKADGAAEAHQHITPWVSTVFIVLYPLLGSAIFGPWADLAPANSIALPIMSLMLISPPEVFFSNWWRVLFTVYLFVGWVLLSGCLILWFQNWRVAFRQWTHDLSIKHYQKTYPVQVR